MSPSISFSCFPQCSLWKQEEGVVGNGPIALRFIAELLDMNPVLLVIFYMTFLIFKYGYA